LFAKTDFGAFLENAFAFSSDDDLATSKVDISKEFESYVAAGEDKPKPKASKKKELGE
jgi:hypothetical protein